MKRLAYIFTIVAIGLAVTSADAQQRGGRGSRGRGPGGPDGPPDGRGGLRRVNPFTLMQMLPERIDMSDEQVQQLADILNKYEPQWQEQQQRREEVRALARAYREARESGDDAAADEIREQLRGVRQQAGGMMRSMLEEVEGILDEGQQAEFERLRSIVRRMMPRGMGRGRALQQMIEQAPEYLELDEQQMAVYEKALADFRDARQAMRERWRELAGVREQLRDARAAGDDELAEQLMEQLRGARMERPQPTMVIDALKEVLRPDQLAKLEQWQERFMQRRGGERGRALDLRRVVQVAKQLDLTSEQNEQLKQIIRETQAVRDQERLSREDREQLAQTVKDQVAAILNPEQAAQFEELLNGDRRGPRGERRERGHRGERGRRGGPPQDEWEDSDW